MTRFMCEAPECDNEVYYEHKFENKYSTPSEWYQGNYCSEHMIKHLEHCIAIIKSQHHEETP